MSNPYIFNKNSAHYSIHTWGAFVTAFPATRTQDEILCRSRSLNRNHKSLRREVDALVLAVNMLKSRKQQGAQIVGASEEVLTWLRTGGSMQARHAQLQHDIEQWGLTFCEEPAWCGFLAERYACEEPVLIEWPDGTSEWSVLQQDTQTVLTWSEARRVDRERDAYVGEDPTSAQVRKRDGSRCRFCLKDVMGEHFTRDHVVPVAHEGLTTIHNMITLCWPCNEQKGANTFRHCSAEWKPYLPWLHNEICRLVQLSRQYGYPDGSDMTHERLVEMFLQSGWKPGPLYLFPARPNFDPTAGSYVPVEPHYQEPREGSGRSYEEIYADIKRASTREIRDGDLYVGGQLVPWEDAIDLKF